jgi:hypothetical protein
LIDRAMVGVRGHFKTDWARHIVGA